MTRLQFAVLTALFLALVLVFAPAASALMPDHDCAFCHNLHASQGNALLQAATSEATCMSCHDPAAGGSTLKVAVHTNKVGSSKAAFRMTCMDCHNPHDYEQNEVLTTNLKLIGDDLDGTGVAKINTPNSGLRVVIFTSRGTDAGGPSMYSFADNDEDGNSFYSAVCETCHTDTLNHQNGTVLPDSSNHGHYTGLNCTVCHAHEDSFWGAGGACDACHNAPQDNSDGVPTWQTGRREIISEFSRASHHLTGTLDTADCEVCHLQDNHQAGVVRLKNPDNPTSTTPLVVLDGGVDPLTNDVEAGKLAVFCLACHDADGYDGANPTLPFTDGQTPPDVASTWGSASHNTVGSLTCFGPGTTGCHGSGHGSQKRKLLALADSAPTPPANAEEEEGFCFNCHQSGGISSIDVKSGFDTPTLWADDVTQFGLTLNDRHDVEYADAVLSGAKVECTDCHNPHEANAAQPWKSDPDPNDGRVPGVSADPGTPGSTWFEDMAGAGLGTDAYSEFCLDCHDGSFPATVSDHSPTPLRDILFDGGGANGWLNNSHGAGPSGASLKTGANYWALDDVVACWACHQAHPGTTPQPVNSTYSNNLFQMNDFTLGTDGVSSPPSDGTPYEITSLTTRRDDTVNSYFLCNTCHTGSMGSGKLNCSDCHTHSDNRF